PRAAIMSGRLFAIGDVHGNPGELGALLDSLPLSPGDVVCFVGDYIDRGHDSKGVIDLLLAARGRTDVEWVFLKGNHEDMCLSFLGRSGNWGDSWLANGGVAAVRSYGVGARSEPAAVGGGIPRGHLAFIGGPGPGAPWGAGPSSCTPASARVCRGRSRPTRTSSGSVRSSSGGLTGCRRPSSSGTLPGGRCWSICRTRSVSTPDWCTGAH